MEIQFIWLLSYKNFKEQGFNFSSEYIFNVEKLGKKAYSLTISKNKSYIPNFFEKSNILNVTAIIGQNGTGKSNILEFIKTSFPEGYSSIQSQAIVAFKSNESSNRDLILIPNNSIKVEVIQTESNFEILRYPFNDAKEATGLNGEDFSSADYVYYSNSFDLKNEEINMTGIHNLSTLGLLKSDTNDKDERIMSTTGGNYDSYKANEIRRNIQFLLSEYTDLLKEFPLPENLFIEILNTDMKYFQNGKNQDVQDLISVFQTELSSYQSNSSENFLNLIYVSVFLNFLATDREYSSLSFIKKLPLLEPIRIRDYVIKFFKELPLNMYYDKNTNQKIPIRKHNTISEVALEFFIYTEQLLSKKTSENASIKYINGNTFIYSINEDAIEELTKFLNLYINLKGLTDFLDFNWRNLSSGEQSLFTFVSRFYHLKNHQIQHEDLKKNIVILIDEGDIYFHPAWQKRFFKITIDYLSALFKDHFLQFLFTSNTPFITSDLPKSNVIFIERISKGKIRVHSADNDRAETFGGNIHTLFADSFYMEDALIGDFAKEKINRIIKFLNGTSSIKRDDYKKTIEIIGEPILKRKLHEMWLNKFGVDDEIEELQKRIKELRSRKND